MKKGVKLLGNQIREEVDKAQGLISELNLVNHPLGQTICDLSAKTSQLIALLGTDSSNSNLPPSQDPYRTKNSKASQGKKPGGQPGHEGTRLVPFENPDEIISLQVDKSTLPHGAVLVRYECRQVVEYETKRRILEYQAEVYKTMDGQEITAQFPEYVTGDIQYGKSVKAQAVYLSVFQLLPYNRISEHFVDQLHIPLSAGSIHNFLKLAYNQLNEFDIWLKKQLLASRLLHLDETGININGSNFWIHTTCNEHLTLLVPHARRGREAVDEIGILPDYKGITCHDCWSTYFAYEGASHVLCNAHFKRELKGIEEKYQCHWPKLMTVLYEDMYKAWIASDREIPPERQKKFRARYRNILTRAEKECEVKPGGRKNEKRTKAQNLIKRMREHESEILKFLEDPKIPFTNNLAERDLRMAKVQQKISGCFRSMEGAKMFCRIRSYLSTCHKNGVSASEALNHLFNGQLPEFINLDLLAHNAAE